MAAYENEGETGAARLGRDGNARGTRGPIKMENPPRRWGGVDYEKGEGDYLMRL
jgi:hypothetical protein